MRKKEKETREMMNMISSTVKTALETRNNYGKRDSVRCFYCDRIVHSARDCFKRKDKEDNKSNFNYFSKCKQGMTQVESECVFEGKEIRKEEVNCKQEKKSKIMNGLDALEREFPRVFKV
jgi:hypothetical protein